MYSLGITRRKNEIPTKEGILFLKMPHLLQRKKKLLNKVPSIYTKSFMTMVYTFLGVNMYVVACS